MLGGGSERHRRVLVIATVVALVAWVTGWHWLGGKPPLHAYYALGMNNLTAQQGSLIVIGGIVQVMVIAVLAPSIAKAWTPEQDKKLAKLLERRDVLYAILGFLSAELCLALALGALDFHPITEDEKTYIFQARVLLTGHLTTPEMPEQRAFMQPFLVSTPGGAVSGQYFWAQPAFVAIGEAVGLPWLAIGFQVAVAVFFAGKLADELTGDRRVGLVAAAIVASSPLVVSTGATLHSGNLAIACSAAALWGLVRLTRRPEEDEKPRSKLAGTVALGIATGIALHNRLLDHAAILAGAALVLLIRERGKVGGLIKTLLPAILVSVPFIVLLGLTNRGVTGSPWATGYTLFNGGRGWKTMGFGMGPFGVERTVSAAAANELTVWALLSIFVSGSPIAFGLLAPAVLTGKSRRLHLIGAGLFVCCVYTLAYFFYCGAPLTQTGPVYFDALMPVIATTIAIAAIDLHEKAAERPEWRRLVPAVLIAQTAAGMILFWPSQVVELVRVRAATSVCEDLVAQHHIKSALVFVGTRTENPESWVFHPPLPHPKLDDDVLYVKVRTQDKNMAVAEAHAKGRPIYAAICINAPTPTLMQFDPFKDETKPIDE